MKKINDMKLKILIALLLVLAIVGCEEYEDFTNDYEFSAAYFAYQNPIRTVLTDDINFDVGVVIGGLRSNDSDQFVSFEIAPELLTDPDIVGDNVFELLPNDYYNLSDNNNITIPRGELVGFVEVLLDEQKFLNDTLATENNYALPFLLKDTSLDSILSGSEAREIPRKDYSIVVLKYQHRAHGEYYHRGQRVQYEPDGVTVDTIINYIPQAYQIQEPNIFWTHLTVNSTTLITDGIANFPEDGDNNNYSLLINHPRDNNITITEGPDSAITGIVDNGSSYDSEKRWYYLNYEYTTEDNIRNVMTDTLKFRDNLLKLELW